MGTPHALGVDTRPRSVLPYAYRAPRMGGAGSEHMEHRPPHEPLPAGEAPRTPDTSFSPAKIEHVIATWLRLGRNTKATARELKMSRQTVTKYVKHGDPRRGIAPAVGRPDASGGSSGVVAAEGEEGLAAASPPPPAVAPAAPPPRAPVTLPPTGGANATGAPRPVFATGTREEAEAGMLTYARLQRQLATARVNETAVILRRVKEGVKDPLTGKVQRGRVSQEDREVLALLRDGARTSPMELLKLYEMEERLLQRLSPATAMAEADDGSLEELQREVARLAGQPLNRPEGQ